MSKAEQRVKTDDADTDKGPAADEVPGQEEDEPVGNTGTHSATRVYKMQQSKFTEDIHNISLQ